MTDKVDPTEIETIVGAIRDPTFHIARAVSAEKKVYILHPMACVAKHPDLRDCYYSQVLDDGIRDEDWEKWLDQPVHLAVASDDQQVSHLVPLGRVAPPVPPVPEDIQKEFYRSLATAWEDLTQDFFEKVDKQRQEFALTDRQIANLLYTGYGDVISDDWHGWVGDDVVESDR